MRYLAGVFLLALLASMATAVSAHDAAIAHSAPANGEVLTESPPEVVAWFVEELVSGESTIMVFNTQGEQVDNGDGGVNLNDPDHASMIVTLPPLPDGSYTVQWRATLLDGDASDGAFAFAVGAGQTAVPAIVPAVTTTTPTPESSTPGNLTPILIGSLFVLLLISGLIIRRRQA